MVTIKIEPILKQFYWVSVSFSLTYTHTPVFRALAGWGGCTLGRHFPWTKTKQLLCSFLFAFPIMILFCFYFLTSKIISCMPCTKLHNLHSPIQHFNIFPKTRSTHSLMCLATKMWSMKMCSFVPFFLKRPRRAACEKVKWIICSYLYTVWETYWNRIKTWNTAI